MNLKKINILTLILLLGLFGHSQPITQIQKLLASNGTAEHKFGSSVSISGDYAVIGATGCGNGAAYVFQHQDGQWVQQAQLTPDDGLVCGSFASSVSISGDVIMVGDRSNVKKGKPIGAVYVYEKPENGWENMTQTAKLIAPDGKADDGFGWSVCLSGDIVLVSSLNDDDNGENSGSVYFFTKPINGWTSMAKVQKVKPNDGDEDDIFGSDVSIYGNFAIIGAIGNDDNGPFAGAAYIFYYNGATWVQQSKLLPEDGISKDYFGSSVAISNDYALIGAYKGSTVYDSAVGSAYVFQNDNGSWIQKAKLISDDGNLNDSFGKSVSIWEDFAVVAAENDNVKTGSVYLFQKPESGWNNMVQTNKITANDGAESSLFGKSVCIDENRLIVGAYHDSENGFSAGAAYLFGPDITGLDAYNEVNKSNFFQLNTFPNPFNSAISIAYSQEEKNKISIKVYDQTGRLIEVLHDGQQTQGKHKISWDASDVNNGIYILRMSSVGKVVHQNILKM